MRIYALILIATLFLASCGKDKFTLPEEYLSGNAGNDTARGNSLGSYLPVSKGTTWTYVETNSMTPGEQIITSTCTGKSILENGEYYFEMLTRTAGKSDPETSYLYSANNKYQLYGQTTSSADILTIDFLHSNAAINVPWESPTSLSGSINGIDSRIIGVIKEKGITLNVRGKEYKNVIHSYLELQYDFGLWETFAYYNFYTAKGIGVIRLDTKIDAYGTIVTLKSELKSYSIGK